MRPHVDRYWYFHWNHHRFTNDPLRDPELSGSTVDRSGKQPPPNKPDVAASSSPNKTDAARCRPPPPLCTVGGQQASIAFRSAAWGVRCAGAGRPNADGGNRLQALCICGFPLRLPVRFRAVRHCRRHSLPPAFDDFPICSPDSVCVEMLCQRAQRTRCCAQAAWDGSIRGRREQGLAGNLGRHRGQAQARPGAAHTPEHTQTNTRTHTPMDINGQAHTKRHRCTQARTHRKGVVNG